MAVLAACAAAAALVGCQSYRPAPLDLAGYQVAWAAREPASPAVAEYARRLAAASGRPPRRSALPAGPGERGLGGGVGEAADAAQPGGTSEPPDRFDPSDGLSLREAEVVALFFNPQLRAARLKARVPAAGVAEAGRWEDPSLQVDAERILEGVSHPWVIGGMLNLTLPLSGRLPLERDKAAAEADVARAQAALEEHRVLAELGGAWAELAVADQRAALVRAYVTDLEAVVGQADKLRAAGELPPLEAGLFRVELARRRAELASLGPLRQEQEMAVKALLGLVPEAPVRLHPTLGVSSGRAGRPEGTRPAGTGPATRAAGPDDAGAGGAAAGSDRRRWLERHHPKLRLARAEYEAAERALALEVRKQYPDVTVGGGFDQDEGTHRLLGGLTVPLPILNANRRAIAEARANRDAARAAAGATYEGLVAALARAEAAVAAARARREVLGREVVPLADEQVRAARALGRLGDAGAVVVFEALTRAHEVRLELLDAAGREAAARVQRDALLRSGPVVGPDDDAPAAMAKEER